MANAKDEEGDEASLQDHWYLVDTHGQKFRLPKTMLFLGREECDVVVASQSVDKRHAVLTFDLYLNRFKVKDLSTTNGTYVNNSRIPEEEYVTLNHMDSIRLGQGYKHKSKSIDINHFDAMMYHIEQGSQITTLGGQLPDPHYIPSWASRAQDSGTLHVHALAECQGCIAEQKIDHTCSLKLERRPSDGDTQITDLRHLTHLHNEQQHHLHHGRSREHLAHPISKLTQQSNGDHPSHTCPLSDQPPLQQPKSRDDSNQQHFHLEDQASATDDLYHQHPNVPDQYSDVPTVGRNTWPKKRQVRKTAHVESVFSPSDSLDTSDYPENVASETMPANVGNQAHISKVTGETIPASEAHPASAASEAHPAGAVQTMFFVTFDDALCNADTTSAGEKERRSRITRNPAPSELGAVKKGTPLYGQPSWWGEAEGDATACAISRSDGNNKNNSKNSRPTNLGLRGSEVSVAKKPGTGSKVGVMESGHAKTYSNPTYMEIPIKDGDSPVRADKIKDVPTPAKSLSSSLSKDSLSVSPELKQQPNKNAKMQSPSADVNTSMSFTVDLDDPEHPPKKSLNIGSSISEFVPSKIRKNFRERKAVSSKTSSKESTPSKNSEEHDLSPLSQRKIDEVWNAAVEGKGKSWLSSMQANVGSSLRSPNLEDIDRLSEFSDERRSQDRESDRKGSLKRPVSSKSPQISSKAVPPSGIGSCSRSPAGVNLSQYADPTSYLIDRMFEGGSSGPLLTDKQESPEHKLYREAAGYDKTMDSRRSTDKALARPVIDSTPSPPATSKNMRKTTLTKAVQQHVVPDEGVDDDDLRIIEDIPVSDNGVDEKEDKEDKASEAGTYTIEADMKEGQEEEEARKRIDQVFGVDVESFNADQPIIDPLRLASPGGYDNVYDFDDEDDDDGERTPLDESCQSPIDGDTDLIADDDYDEESSDMAATEGVQMWVSQLTALTNHKSADAGRIAMEDGEASLSKKPPQGISRKRPGTGRKLPSIPSDKSPVSSEHGSHNADLDILTGDDVFTRRTPHHTANGRNSADSNGKTRSNSSQSRSKTTSNGPPLSPSTSNRSRGSVDTEVLLQDTETAMVAMQARMTHKSGQCRKESYSQDSDTDASSTVALVNGDENFVKSRQYKSPRDALALRQKNDLSIKPSITSSSVPVKKPMVPSYSQTVPSKSKASPRSTPSSGGTRKSIVSDVVSRRDSMDNDSIISDVSSDTGEGHHSRASLKGKGTITMTRTNKTFDLRRARVDSYEEPATPRSVKSSATSKSNASSSYGRSQSLHSTTRNKSLTTSSRSNATSLGAQIVKKSQSNINEEKVRKAGKVAVCRTDSGGDKHSQSQRLRHSSSLATSHPAVANISSKRESIPKSQQRLTPTNKAGFMIAGISTISSRSQSQPGSRSNSPKSAEKMAWKRRKEYDARKSVADAKAGKTKDGGISGVIMRQKPSASSSIRRRMIRSASFTNSGVSLGIHNSVSSSQDLSDCRDSFNQNEEFRRAFIPFHSSLRNDRSTHSADEDDSLVSTNSTKDVTRSLVSLLKTPSAFTPPPHRNKPVSPEISPPSRAYLALRRRTLNMEGLSTGLQANGHFEGVRHSHTQSSHQTSYDSLIVASIYQLSLKLKTATDKTLSKLRDQNRVSHTPSPIDEFLSDSSKSEIPAWKTANQELAGTLKNLRKLERHVHMMNAVIFPHVDVNSEVLSHAPASRQRLLEDIERKFGFQPIDHPHPYEADGASPEMAEFSGQF